MDKKYEIVMLLKGIVPTIRFTCGKGGLARRISVLLDCDNDIQEINIKILKVTAPTSSGR